MQLAARSPRSCARAAAAANRSASELAAKQWNQQGRERSQGRVEEKQCELSTIHEPLALRGAHVPSLRNIALEGLWPRRKYRRSAFDARSAAEAGATTHSAAPESEPIAYSSRHAGAVHLCRVDLQSNFKTDSHQHATTSNQVLTERICRWKASRLRPTLSCRRSSTPHLPRRARCVQFRFCAISLGAARQAGPQARQNSTCNHIFWSAGASLCAAAAADRRQSPALTSSSLTSDTSAGHAGTGSAHIAVSGRIYDLLMTVCMQLARQHAALKAAKVPCTRHCNRPPLPQAQHQKHTLELEDRISTVVQQRNMLQTKLARQSHVLSGRHARRRHPSARTASSCSSSTPPCRSDAYRCCLQSGCVVRAAVHPRAPGATGGGHAGLVLQSRQSVTRPVSRAAASRSLVQPGVASRLH